MATAACELASGAPTALVLLAPAGFGRIRLAEAISAPGVRDLSARLLPLALSSSLALNVAYATMVSHGCTIDGAAMARIKARAPEALPGARSATTAVVAAGLSGHAFHRRRVAFSGPVSALWGAHDRIVPPGHAAGVRKALPQASVEVWPSLGHHPQRECPNQLQEFIERACGKGGSTGRRSGVSPSRAA